MEILGFRRMATTLVLLGSSRKRSVVMRKLPLLDKCIIKLRMEDIMEFNASRAAITSVLCSGTTYILSFDPSCTPDSHSDTSDFSGTLASPYYFIPPHF